jgi:hypothetical protein
VKTLGKPKIASKRRIKENAARPKLRTTARKLVKLASKMMGFDFKI